MTFSNWPEELHAAEDQKKRLDSAKSSKTTPSSIDKVHMSGIFPGSGISPYRTTLETCTCGDFVRRKLPCKHMYRLAIELGLLDVAAVHGTNKNLQTSLEGAVAELENLSDEAQIVIKDFLYSSLYGSQNEFPILAGKASQELRLCGLLETIDSPSAALRVFKRNQIIKILDEHTITGFKRNMSLNNLIGWCVENITDMWSVFPQITVFRFSDSFQKSQRQTYIYLLRKYEWDSYLDENMNAIQYPHGAVFEDVSLLIPQDGCKTEGNPNVCHFPDDKITKLLTLYGHNRCLNGYDITSST